MRAYKEIENCVRYGKIEELTFEECLIAIERMSVIHYIEDGIRPDSNYAQRLENMLDMVKQYLVSKYK